MDRSACIDVLVIKVTEDGPLGLRVARTLLSTRELSAAERHRRPEDRSRTIIAQAALRQLVARRTGGDPRAVTFERDNRGRPLVLDPPGVRASIAHSGAFVACAVARRHVGIDIERSDRPEADGELARRVCTPAERHHLEQTPGSARRQALVRLWVRKEALAKALGLGLELSFATVDVRRETPVLSGDAQTDWAVRDLVAPAGYLAAVAARGRRWRVRAPRQPLQMLRAG